MSLNAQALADKLTSSVGEGMPSAATRLSLAIKSYCETNGTPVKGVKVELLPCSGSGWLTLAQNATSEGVGDFIIQTAIAAELSASITTIMTPSGPVITPCVFNLGATVNNLKECSDYKECWLKIAQAILDYISPELI